MFPFSTYTALCIWHTRRAIILTGINCWAPSIYNNQPDGGGGIYVYSTSIYFAGPAQVSFFLASLFLLWLLSQFLRLSCCSEDRLNIPQS